MKLFHHLVISVFGRDDNPLPALDLLLPFPTGRFFDGVKQNLDSKARYSLRKDRARLDISKTRGFDDEITVYEVYFEKESHTNGIFKSVISSLNGKDREHLRNEAFLHAGDDGRFFLRIDKQSLLGGTVTLTNGGDCFRFEFAMAVYPKNPFTIRRRVDDLKSIMGELG